ncbi:GNAT family N-acetyltransferase [Avibacterium gallinarum]|uniref:ElaA protein n=1 Tax=Avibacterium gallinarum TaxID=755 RepID=A0A379AY75_AVIGA|nr:GNAT family N-acetyltransferase [Avibacterium gallinarum]POY44440.1 GNAT family N-acetyltransferase [Avibacterium gallinarum]TDP30212.1 ElaA protein [Avibacterium gallinarum]SUB26712.1 putative acyltransferase [Avibacterium gallinarum]
MTWNVKTFAELSTAELFAIYQVRTAVFVVEQQCAYQEVDHWDQSAVHFWQEFDGKICAYCRIIPQTDCIHIGRVLVAQQARGKGLAKELVQQALAYCQQHWATEPVLIQAQTYLQNFYRTFGFQPTSAEYLEDGIPHLDMELVS